jgi:NADPH:quinone reductase-like Zn-dependent oxidoreductase
MATLTMTATMRAVVSERYGDPARMAGIREVAAPTPGPGEVLVRVAAAGIGVGDWLAMAGLPYVARPSYGLLRPRHATAGQELAGRVVGLGEGVTDLALGDEVVGFARGAFAELATTAAELLVRIPAGTSVEAAAAIPVSGLAAHQAVVDLAGARTGDRILVIGASGAVGTFAVQIGKALGAEVTGVASTANVELVHSIGADDVIDYRREDIGARGRPYDVVLDLAGNRPLSEIRSVLTERGRAVLVGGSGGRWLMSLGRTIRAMVLNPFVSQRLRPLFSAPAREGLVAVADLVGSGAITPVVADAVPVDQISRVLAGLGERHGGGKTVITF